MVLFGRMSESNPSASAALPRAAQVLAVPGEQAFPLRPPTPGSWVDRAGSLVAPHVHHDMLQIILAMSGDCTFMIDDERHEVRAPCLITVPGGGVHSFEVGPSVRGWATIISHHRVLDLVVNRGLDLGFLLHRSHVTEFGANRKYLHDLAISLRNLCQETGGGLDGEAVCVEALQRIVLCRSCEQFGKGTNPAAQRMTGTGSCSSPSALWLNASF